MSSATASGTTNYICNRHWGGPFPVGTRYGALSKSRLASSDWKGPHSRIRTSSRPSHSAGPGERPRRWRLRRRERSSVKFPIPGPIRRAGWVKETCTRDSLSPGYSVSNSVDPSMLLSLPVIFHRVPRELVGCECDPGPCSRSCVLNLHGDSNIDAGDQD